MIWGTNISINDSMATFKSFLYNFTTKYRLWAEGATEQETRSMGDAAEDKKYLNMTNDMLKLGTLGLNLDAKDLKAYPSTQKFWHQLQAYPGEIIPVMDQAFKEVIYELACKEDDIQNRNRNRDLSRSDAPGEAAQAPPSSISTEVEKRTYKVIPFGLDAAVNMRDLDPAGTSMKTYQV